MDTAQSKQIITFLIKKEVFGLPIQSVKEIVRYPEITEVPRAPAYLMGLTNLRGTIVPVIDSRIKLNLSVTEVTDHTRLIILETGTTPTGIIVDKVKGVVELESAEREEPPSIVSSEIDKKFISAVIKSKEEIIMELDLESLCDIDLKAIKSDKSAQTIEEKEQTQKAIEELQLVTFIVSEEEYAFPIEKVREILRIHEITEVPNAPEYVKGIITVRNQILPVIDLRKLFKLQSLSDEINFEIERMYKECESVKDFKNTELWKWLDEFRTSSEAIGLAIQNVKKEFSRNSVEKFKEVIKEHIKEDQRIVVVEISGVNLGFIVDRMKQVVRVPKDLVEPAPTILKTDNSENIEGIVKLNQGERLIMLVNESNLFDKKTIEELRKMEQRQTEEEKRSEKIHELQFVTFRLGEINFAIPIEEVQEINRLETITHVPRAPYFVEGVMNLRGNVIPVIDLRKRFDMPEKQYDELTKVIIISLAGRLTGLIVDAVSEVLRVQENLIEPPPKVIAENIQTRFIKGICKLTDRGRIILILNISEILSKEEQEKLQQLGKEEKVEKQITEQEFKSEPSLQRFEDEE